MTTPANRFKGWAESLSEAWKGLLKGWMVSWFSFGIEVFFDVLGKAAAPKLKPLVDALEATKVVPPELQPILDEIKSPTGQVGAMFSQSAGSALIGGAIGKIVDALLLPIAYGINKLTKNVILTLDQYLAAWLRGKITDEYLKEAMYATGLDDPDHALLKELTQVRLDPISWITAFRRKYEDFSKIENDLRDQGWDADRIEALKAITLFMPSAIDIVSWYAREVYEPEMIDRYGLDSELPDYEKTDFPKIGVDSTQAKNYWMAHWEHASYMQIREMVHRGVLSKSKTMPAPPTTKEGWTARDAEGVEAAYDWYRLVEIPPFWRSRLTEMMFEVPTRVDVRRWWDMRTIDEAELYNIYHRQGYHGTDLDNYVLWTKVYVAFPDLIARWSKGWITEEQVRTELVALGMPAARVEEMIQTKIKPTEQEPVTEAKKVTQTAIIKWVKEDPVARWEQGVDLLMDLGYDDAGARFILEAYIAEMGSPETFEDWKGVTSRYRLASGRIAVPVPEELKAAADELVKVKLEVEALERSVKEEEAQVVDEETAPDAATAKLKQVRVALNRARSELQRVQQKYDSLVARWKHGAA